MKPDSIFYVPPTRVQNGQQFAKILRVTRLAAGLSRARMAEHVGCTVSSITLRELGNRRISVADAVQQLNAAGYDLVVMRAGQIADPPDAVRDPQA